MWGWSHLKYSPPTRQVYFWFLLDSLLILLVLLSLLSVSPPPQPESSGRVSGGRPQALCWGEPQVHLSLPFLCSTEALSLFVDHSMVAAAWQKDWRAHGGRDPRGLAVTLLPILPTERLGGKVREERCRLDWNRNVWCHLRKIQNIWLWYRPRQLNLDCRALSSIQQSLVKAEGTEAVCSVLVLKRLVD